MMVSRFSAAIMKEFTTGDEIAALFPQPGCAVQ